MTELKSPNEFDSLEAFFNERLKDASFASPQGPWVQIEAELQQMEKEKRKRRFLWFFASGLILLCGLASLWFFVLSDKFESNTIAQKQNTETIAAKNNSIQKNVTPPVTENKTIENLNPPIAEKTEKVNAEEKSTTTEKTAVVQKLVASLTSSNTKIQLAACTKKANPAIFNKVPFKVIEVQGNDGYIRYFAETSTNKEEALKTIHNSGFEKAFVKKNFQPMGESAIVKNEGVIETELASYVAANIPVAKTKIVSEPTQNNAIAVAAIKNTPETKTVKIPTENNAIKTTEPANTNAISVNSTPAKTESNTTTPAVVYTNIPTGNNSNSTAVIPPAENKNTNTASVPETKTDEVKTSPLENQNTNTAGATKTDSVAQTIVTNEIKPDSLPKKTEVVDSAKTTVADVYPASFTPEWAILLLAGPNIFAQNVQSSVITPANESQTSTVNIEAKLQFKPFQKFSFSAGVNYNQLSISQGNPAYFQFNKNQTTDYIFYSSHGAMPVRMRTMLDGFNVAVPFDTFFAKYTYTSKLNVLSIPLEANFHFLNKTKFSLFAGVGVNTSYVISQQTKLTIIKENFNNDVSYNNITVNKFNISMLFSLGCDIRLGKKLYLTLVPSYRYGLTNMSATSGTTFSPAYFSGNAGIKFKF